MVSSVSIVDGEVMYEQEVSNVMKRWLVWRVFIIGGYYYSFFLSFCPLILQRRKPFSTEEKRMVGDKERERERES